MDRHGSFRQLSPAIQPVSSRQDRPRLFAPGDLEARLGLDVDAEPWHQNVERVSHDALTNTLESQ